MIAAPWYLLAAGIGLLILGLFISALTRPARPPVIDARMRDEDIARALREEESGGSMVGGLLVFLGIACIAVSIGWRLVRAAIAFAT